MSTMLHPVARVASPARWNRQTPTARHSGGDFVPELIAQLRSLVLDAWRAAPHLTERESMPMRNLARRGDWRWPSVHVLLETLCAMRSPAAWDAISAWAQRAKALLGPDMGIGLRDAWHAENRAQMEVDNAMADALHARTVVPLDAALAHVEAQIRASEVLRDALLAKRQEIVRPMGVPR